MTTNKINCTIAEYVGWRLSSTVQQEDKYEAILCWIAPDCSEWQQSEVPRYNRDLNAMHNAEMWLKENDAHAFGCYCSNLYTHVEDFHCADALQRAEWFLKTVGKWIE